MDITILLSDPMHPIAPHLQDWATGIEGIGHSVSILNKKNQLVGGTILFLVSCSEIISEEDRRKFNTTLVLHASNLPQGRGWSPYIWAILGGSSEITVCALEASEPVDTGRVWLRKSFSLQGHELLPEINEKLFAVELELMSAVVQDYGNITPQPQSGDPGPYLRRRTPADSRLNPEQSIAEQFDLLRVTDPERFPAFFEYRGQRYILRIEKATHDQ